MTTIPSAGGVPTGIVTFLFTDVEGSTRLWAADAGKTAVSIETHDRIIKQAIQDRGGVVFGWAGDHFRGAFEDPRAAVAAAMAAQTVLAQADWGDGPVLKVRMGLHRGRATPRDGDYFGSAPNTAARIESLAHGGQVLMSAAVHDEVDVESLDLGHHRLRDVPKPVGIHQLGITANRPIRTVDPSLSTLPNPGSIILGRDELIAEVRGLLETQPMVTVTGMGGSGKTRLAVEVAYQELPGRYDGCYFADLSAISEGSEVAAAVAEALRLEPTAGGGSSAIEQLAAYLASRDALLVLDNCEHVVEECADLAEQVLARSTATAILATTRQRLGVAGERVIAVPSLDADDDRSPAVELFVERALAVNPAGRFGRAERATISEICRRLDGMPLAIELAAARSAVLTPAEILDRMADRFRLLSGGRGRHRRRTLQATLDWSYDLLDEEEQAFFRSLGLFVGSFDLAAAQAVTGISGYDAMDLMESLVAKNLVVTDDSGLDTARYRLLESVRIYAGDQLTRHGDAGRAQDAHADCYRRLTATDDFGVSSDLGRSASLRPDWPNIATTLEYFTSAGDFETAASIAFGCQALWESRLPATEGRRWLEMLVDQLPDGPERDWITYGLMMLCSQLDDWTEVHSLLRQMVASASPGPRTLAAGILAFFMCREGPDEALTLASLGQSLAAEHDLGPEFLCPSVCAEGVHALYDARFEHARTAFEDAHELSCERRVETNHFVMTGIAVAAAQVLTGDPEAALESLDTADWSASIWDSSAIVRALALIDLGRSAEAADLVVGFGYDALRGRLARMSNDAMVGLAALAINQGDIEHGWKLLQQAASPRTPFTIGLAEGLADRIGRGDAMRHMHRLRDRPLAELDASEALRAELTRLRSARFERFHDGTPGADVALAGGVEADPVDHVAVAAVQLRGDGVGFTHDGERVEDLVIDE